MQSTKRSAGSPDASPFMGGAPFGINDAAVFCGRDRAVAGALEQLRRNRENGCGFLLIHGEDGGGKSSLVHAGIAPRVIAPEFLPAAGKWRRAEVSPGDQPVEALAKAIRRAIPELGKLRDRWSAERLAKSLANPAELELAVSAVGAALDRISAAKPAQLLVLADPLAEDGAFLRAVTGLARSRRVWVVATLRSGLLPWFAGHPDLCPALHHGGCFFLPPPDARELREMIEGPAAVAGLEFEAHPETGQDLATAIHRAALAEDGRRILPRLQTALTRLYDQRLCTLLTWDAWERIGGLAENSDSPATTGTTGRRVETRVYLAAAAFVALLAVVLAIALRDGPRETSAAQRTAVPQPEVAAARLELAAAHAMTGFPADALPHLVAALESDPANIPARELLLETLTRFEWHLPLAAFKPPLPMRALAFGGSPDELIIASEAESADQPFATAITHDLATSSVTGALAPAQGETMHLVSVSPNGARVVIRRGRTLPTSTLLCDAKTLRVIAKLPAWQGRVLPGSCFSWSADGLLFAYPAAAGDEPDALLKWRISDAASGQTVAESGLFPPHGPEWLASHVNRDRLRAVAADGSIFELPLAPGSAPRTGTDGHRLTTASFSADGARLQVRRVDGREPSRHTLLNIAHDPEDDTLRLDVAKDLARTDDASPETWQAGGQFHFSDAARAPIPTESEIELSSSSGNRVALASAADGVMVYQFLPRLVRVSGELESRALTAGEVAALRHLAEALGGRRFTTAGNTLTDLTHAERLEAAALVDRMVIQTLLSGEALHGVLEAVAARTFIESEPADFEPLWDRLARGGEIDRLLIARHAAVMGADHPWFQQHVRGLIGEWDAKLVAGDVRGEFPADLHELAGDSAELAAFKQLAWEARATAEPAAVDAMARHASATAAAYEAAPSLVTALDHAEVLAMAGDAAAAAAFFEGKLATDAELTLEQAHLLIAADLVETSDVALTHAVTRLKSPWLALAWIEAVAATDAGLSQAVELVMEISDGRGPAAVGALRQALRQENSAAIASVLEHANEIPANLKTYATARALWAQGQESEVFALYPQGFPDLQKSAEAADWDGWEQALVWLEVSDFFASVASGLSPLDPGPEATIDELKLLAARLLDSETAEAFGAKRVRDAMVATALALTQDADSSELVMLLADTALLAGADPLPCLRAEARALMNQGRFTAAYARWLRLLEAPVTELIADDFLEAAHCVFEDEQDAPALVLLNRGSGQFPGDPAYALNAAWLALSTGHVTDASVLLERGFQIGYPADQRETALALRVSIAEQTQQTELANALFADLLRLSDEWSSTETLDNLGWPDLIRQPLAQVQERHQNDE